MVESDSSVWNPDPLYITNSNHIKNIQKYFTKRLFARCNIPKCSYTDRLIFLNIKSLSFRRLVTELVLTYNILNRFVDVDPDKIFDVYSNRCRGPAQKIRKILCRINAHLNYFGNRVSTDWNSLPINVTQCKSIVGFRDALKRTSFFSSRF